MNALSLLRIQHRVAERLFEQLDATIDPADQRLLVNSLVGHLTAHMAAEEAVLYPVAYGARSQDLLSEAVEDHRETTRCAAELMGCAPGHRLFRSKLHALRNEFEAHIVEEEDLFEVLERRFGDDLLEKLGLELATAYEREVQVEPRFVVEVEQTLTVG